MQEKHTQLILGVLIGAILGSIVAITLIQRKSLPARFEIRQVTGILNTDVYRVIKMDARTGESWALTPHGWKRILNRD